MSFLRYESIYFEKIVTNIEVVQYCFFFVYKSLNAKMTAVK